MDLKTKAFKVLNHPTELLIAKVLWDNGINSVIQYREWLKQGNDINIQLSLQYNVYNRIHDFEINFINHEEIPNIFNLD